MRPLGTIEQLEKRRQAALDLVRKGKSSEEIANKFGVTERSVRRWRQERKHRKGTRRPALGRTAYLTKEQVKQLEQELLRGAYAHGYREDYWTLDRIGHLIWDLFGTRYTPSGVWRLLDRMNWSCQKVQRQAIQRNEAAIANWKRYSWPRIKKVAGAERNASVNR
jgi:transposase